MARYMAVVDFVPGRKILDAGCGAGYGSHFLAARGAKSVLALDLSPDAIGYARDNFSRHNLEFRVADVSCPLDQSFDTIVSFEVIEHLNEPDRFLAAISAALEPDGVFVVSTPDRTAYRPTDNPNPFHTREYDLNEFRSLLQPHFPNVRIMGEHCLSGIALTEIESHHSGDFHVKNALINLDAYNRYFIAFCTLSQSFRPFLPERVIPFREMDWGHFVDLAARDIEMNVSAWCLVGSRRSGNASEGPVVRLPPLVFR